MPNDEADPDEIAAPPPEGKGRQANPGGGNPPKRNWQGNWKTSKPPGNAVNKQGAQSEGASRIVPSAPQPPAFTLPSGAGQQLELLLAVRRNRLRRFFLRLGVFVLLPSVLVWFYTMFIATPRYVCTYEVTYQTYQSASSLSGGLTQTAVGSSLTDSIDYGTLLNEFVQSEALAQSIDSQLKLREHFSSHKIDWFSRLSENATQKQFLRYWQSHVQVSEGFGGYITITVQGFDPQFTLALAQAIDSKADQMIDALTQQARTAEVNSATKQLSLAATELQAENDKLTQFRNTHGDLDPSFMATQLGTIAGTLEGQLATAEAQLEQDNANMQPGTAQIVQLKLQIAALKSQIAAEKQQLANNSGQPTYSDTVDKYQDVLAEQLLASSTYQAAQQGLVIAEADVAQKQNYVVAFVPPVLPDQPTAPNPWVDTAITFLACIGIYGIGNLLFSAFRDQAGV